jgi:ParB family transcriptional regulator, chromosome partitioning protein
MTDITNITNIPLNKLTAWEGNVRKTQNKGIDELAASIEAHGLLQSLVVRKDGKKFAVVAGNRRLAALAALLKARKIDADFEVPCQVIENGADATEISLAENTVRENMHPADECDAYRDLIDKGAPIADVAARFGKTETYVKQRLKLARVSPVVIEAYRKGKLNLEQVQAFAISDDHAAQEALFQDFDPDRNDADDIRDTLTENDIAVADKRVRYVTLKAYEKAGGTVRRDLFSHDDDGVFILDVPLLDRLLIDKLERAAKTVKKEGWSWVEVMPDFDYQAKSKFHILREELTPLPAKKQAELDALQKEYDELEDQWSNSDDAERPERLDEIRDRIEELTAGREKVWPAETLAIAGAVVHLDHSGKAEITRGLVRPEDMPKKTGKSKATAPDGTDSGIGEDAEADRAEFSAGLIESLTAHRSAAIAARLLEFPDKGMAAVVYAMVLNVFEHRHDTALKVSASPQSLHRVEGSAAFKALEDARETWGHRLPGKPGDIWQWCLEQDQSVLLDLLTFCAACSINAVQTKSDRPENDRLDHASKLATVLQLDMKLYFTPTAENYFTRIGKPQILAAIQAAKGQPPAPAWEKLKKAELANEAERQIAGTGWLPEILR